MAKKTIAWFPVKTVLLFGHVFMSWKQTGLFFCDRDGIKKYDISEIGHERRNGYSWYNKDGSKVLKRYEKWKKEQNK